MKKAIEGGRDMIIGILLALALMMICSMFGISIIFVAPICAILAAVTGGADVFLVIFFF